MPLGEEPPFKKCAPLSRLKGLTPCEYFVLTLGKLPHLFKAALVSPGPSEASNLCSSRENRKGLDGCEEKEGCRAPGDAPKSFRKKGSVFKVALVSRVQDFLFVKRQCLQSCSCEQSPGFFVCGPGFQS